MAEIERFLDKMESTREERYKHGKAGRKGMLNQLCGFRSEWANTLESEPDFAEHLYA